jgi:tetratricopeptide (TPR) repeat protein
VQVFDLDPASIRLLERKTRAPVTLALRKFELQDYYQFLGVKRTTPVAAMRKALMIQSKKCSPQIIAQIKDPELKEMCRDLLRKYTLAYETLSSPAKRKEYDDQQKEKNEEHRAKKRKATDAFQQGMKAYQEQRYNEALDHFEQAIQVFPNNPVYHDMLAEVRSITKSKRGAVRFKSAQLAIQEQKWEEAIKHLKSAIEINSSNIEWLELLLQTLEKVPSRKEEKVEVLRQIIEIEPINPERHLALARTLSDLRRKQEAVDAYYMALKWSDEGLPEAEEALAEFKKKDGLLPSDVTERKERQKKIKEWEKKQKRLKR